MTLAACEKPGLRRSVKPDNSVLQISEEMKEETCVFLCLTESSYCGIPAEVLKM